MAKPFRIAVVLETFAEHARSIRRGVADYADRQSNWELHSIPIGRNHSKMLSAALRCDGVITWPFTDDMVRILQDTRTPIVAVHYFGDFPIPSVTSNHVTVASTAGEHFCGQGFRQFAFAGTPKKFSQERCESFELFVKSRGFVCHSYNAGRTDPDSFEWHAPDGSLVDWLHSLPKPIGILCANDVMAQHVLLAAAHAGVRVPDEAAVVGVDNDEMVCRFTTPRLSSIDYNGETIGYTAASMLDQLLHGKPLARTRIRIDPAKLVVRQSSNVLAVHDPNVADAVRFIREHTSRRLCVDDVLQHVPVARRTLELAFRKLLGRGIHEEIVESRVRKAKQLLTETSFTIPEISDACGFCNRAHLSEVFKEATGHAPATFRREYRHTNGPR